MGNQGSSLYDDRTSLKDLRHSLSREYTPELDWEMWQTTLLTGRVFEARQIKKWLTIKYADYPDLLSRFKKLPEKQFSVPHLPSLNSFHGFDDVLESLAENEVPDFVDVTKMVHLGKVPKLTL